MEDTQLAKMIYHRVMAIMKFALNLEEFSYREKGRNDPRYKTFKQQLMSNTYENLRELFADLEKQGVLSKTDETEDVKDGYKPTPSGGSGYVNSEAFDRWLKENFF
jgi:hypothetical protein